MKLRTIFNAICFAIFLQCFSRLIISRNLVIYETFYDKIEDNNHLSICIKIDSKRLNCNNLKNKSITIDAQQVCRSLVNYFEFIETGNYSPNEILKKLNDLNLPNLFEFNSKVIYQSNYLNSKQLCLFYKIHLINANLEYRTDRNFFRIKIFNKFHLKSNYFLHGQSIPRFWGRIEQLICDDFIDCVYFTITVRQFKNSLLEAPFETNCVFHSNQTYNFLKYETISVRSACLSECLKQDYRLFAFFYTINDTELLDYEHKRTSIDLNKLNKCKSICKPECEEVMYTLMEINYNSKNESFVAFWIGTTKFNNYATALLSKSNYWINFFAMICLFFKISFMSIIFKFNQMIKINFEKKIFISLLTIQLWISLISSLFFGYYHGNLIYKSYLNSAILSYTFKQLTYEPATFTAATCRILNTDVINFANSKNLSIFDLNFLTQKSFQQFNQNLLIKFDDQIETKKVDYRIYYRRNINYMEQCYTFDVKIEEIRYKSLLSMTLLVVQNTTSFDWMCFGVYNKSFTTIDKCFSKINNIIRFDVSDISNCTDYPIQHEFNFECDSQRGCFDRCFIDEYLKLYLKLPSDIPIYIDYFDTYETKSLYFDYDRSSNQTHGKIAEYCGSKFKFKDCKMKRFVSVHGVKESDKNEQDTYTINLFFEQRREGRTFKYSNAYLIFMLLLLYKIIIGISWPQICFFIVHMFNFIFNPKEKLSLRNLIFLSSLIGGSIHSYYLAKEVFFSDLYINIDLQLNYLESNKQLPNLIFCLDHNLKFRKNDRITGDILDRQTKHLNATYLFKEIIYYDLNVSKRRWNHSNWNQLTDNSNFKIDYFFFLKYKCLEISYTMNSESIKNGNLLDILKLKFNQNISHDHYLFTTKSNGTDDFSDYFRLNFNESFRVYFSYLNIVYYNSYQTLTNPNLWFQNGYQINDVRSYLNQLKNDFNYYTNCTTLNVPLYKQFFNFKIDDQLFDNFNLKYLETKNKSINLNYQRTFFSSKKYYHKTKHNSMTIDKLYYSFFVTFTNRSELIQNALNLVFLHFNFYLCELIDLIEKFASFFLIFKPQNIKKLILKFKKIIDSNFIQKIDEKNNQSIDLT